jgi:hypothetical protein
MVPSPRMGWYFFVTMASGKLRINLTIPPFNQPGIANSRLKIMNPITNQLMKEAVIALALFSNGKKIIGMIEAIPKISPAIITFVILLLSFIF